jgi:hypothetical protein
LLDLTVSNLNAVLCFALLCFALLCFALLCFARFSTLGVVGCVVILPACIVTIVIAITIQDSTSSGLLPGSSYSCCIRNLRALVHK